MLLLQLSMIINCCCFLLRLVLLVNSCGLDRLKKDARVAQQFYEIVLERFHFTRNLCLWSLFHVNLIIKGAHNDTVDLFVFFLITPVVPNDLFNETCSFLVITVFFNKLLLAYLVEFAEAFKQIFFIRELKSISMTQYFLFIIKQVFEWTFWL